MLSDSVRPADIAAVIARATGIPVENLMLDEADKLLHLEDKLRARVVGQARPPAVETSRRLTVVGRTTR
jgi:ATP-dependent Clp protease ATP-binding subunit ClpB